MGQHTNADVGLDTDKDRLTRPEMDVKMTSDPNKARFGGLFFFAKNLIKQTHSVSKKRSNGLE